MQQLALTAEQAAFVDEEVTTAPVVLDEEVLMSMPLFDAKQLVAAEFERRYLVRVMERVAGSVSKGAALCNIDRTNFRRLLQRHGLR
jgi:two-component system response regulator GlrR